MARKRFMIALDTDHCLVGIAGGEAVEIVETQIQSDAGVPGTCKSLVELLSGHGYRGEAVVLAVPTAWCLSAGVDLDNLPRQNRHEAMVYRLEEMLPLAAEQIVAAFAPTVGQRTLGVCVQTEQVKPWVDELEQSGVLVQSICPTALLALQSLEDRSQIDAVLWGCGDEIELFTLRQGNLIGWFRLPAEMQDLCLHLKAARSDNPTKLRVFVCDLPEPLLEGLQQHDWIQLERSEQCLPRSATATAMSLLSGRHRPWIDLRRDALGTTDPRRQVRRPLNATILAAMLLLACACGAMLLRASQYNQQAVAYERQQEGLFAQVFPTQRTPPAAAIRRRLEIEQRTLGGQNMSLPGQTPVLVMLNEAMTALPTELRYRILELRLNQTELFLDGQARSHSDADAIAAAMRQLQRFNVEPPTTEQLNAKEVTFKISGVVNRPEEQGGRRRP
jgi:type II secretion system protein L